MPSVVLERLGVETYGLALTGDEMAEIGEAEVAATGEDPLPRSRYVRGIR